MGCLSSSSKKDKDKDKNRAARSTSPSSEDCPVSPQNGTTESNGNTGMVRQMYDALVCSIIRPPRAQYSLRDLGPPEFTFAGRRHHRRDIQLANGRGHTLQCSHWEPVPEQRPAEALPCVVYLHGNSSSRTESLDILSSCLAKGITVFALDCSGSGLSDGDYVSLGHYERLDLEAVVRHLLGTGQTSAVAAWGHSMGAVTALLHTAAHPKPSPSADPATSTATPICPAPVADDLVLAAVVVDSAFMDLEMLAQELVKDGKMLPVSIPGIMVTGAMRMIRATVQKRAGFDLRVLCPIKLVPKSTTPAYFGHGRGDEFIPLHHTQQLQAKYGGPSEAVFFEGDHNSQRPESFLQGAMRFLDRMLRCEPSFACLTPRLNLQRLPWHGSRTARSPANSQPEEEMERAILASLLQPQAGRGTNNTLQQQLEQQHTPQQHQSASSLAKFDTEVVSKLMELGFPEQLAREAAAEHRTVEGAVTHLLESR